MKKMSLQWRLTCIITLYIAVICGCVTMLVYRNGVYYMDSLQEAVDTRMPSRNCMLLPIIKCTTIPGII